MSRQNTDFRNKTEKSDTMTTILRDQKLKLDFKHIKGMSSPGRVRVLKMVLEERNWIVWPKVTKKQLNFIEYQSMMAVSKANTTNEMNKTAWDLRHSSTTGHLPSLKF